MKTNVLFIIIDSLRADKFYGKQKSSNTPNIDKLIKKGTYFTEAISSSDVTGICVGNIFTGMYSQKTGIKQRKFNSKIKTMFDILKENNYNVYGTVPDLTWFNQLTKKFDEVDKFYTANRIQDGLIDGVGKKILERFKSKKMKEPWIYYIHLEDLHEKIKVPSKYDSKNFGETKYERMISYIDEWIGLILAECDLKNTLVIITSDHGDYIPIVNGVGEIPNVQSVMKKGKQIMPSLEPIGLKIFILIRNIVKKIQYRKLKNKLSKEQIRTLNARGNKTLDDETLKIPLLLVGNGIPSKKMDNLVSGVDIFPTILNKLGIMVNQTEIDGRNLNSLIDGKQIEEKPIFIQTGDTQEQKESLMIGIRTSKLKYYRERKNPKQNIFLFNLEEDPLEENNIASSFPEIIKSMEKILEKFENVKPVIEIEEDEKEKEIEKELKKMGYV